MNIQWTRDNHFQFGYDGVPSLKRVHPTQQWWVEYGKCHRPPLDFRRECLVAAEEIRASTNKELWLCLSGGVDSEVAAEAFRESGIEFNAAILQFEDGQNAHDTQWAERYCRRHSIPYTLYSLDIVDFWQSGEMTDIAVATGCVTPQFPSTMKLMQWISDRGGYPVLGSGECYLEIIDGQAVMYEREKVASLYRFLMLNQIAGCAGFFQWSPELMLSFLEEPPIREFVERHNPEIPNTGRIKSSVYAQHFTFKERVKYTGFEMLMPWDRRFRAQLHELMPASHQERLIPYPQLVECLKAPIRSASVDLGV